MTNEKIQRLDHLLKQVQDNCKTLLKKLDEPLTLEFAVSIVNDMLIVSGVVNAMLYEENPALFP